jgi:hypothetical protein
MRISGLQPLQNYGPFLAARSERRSARFGAALKLLRRPNGQQEARKASAFFEALWTRKTGSREIRADAALVLGQLAFSKSGRSGRKHAGVWFGRAARLFHPTALYEIARLALETKRFERAARYFRAAAELRHTGAIFGLAMLHLDGHLRRSSAAFAVRQLRRIAATDQRAARALSTMRAREALRKGGKTGRFQCPDRQMEGDWDIRDSDCVVELSFPDAALAPPEILYWDVDDGEELVVSGQRWDEAVLEFSTLCVSTGWRLKNRLVLLQPSLMMLFRRGASSVPTLVRRLRVPP